jgi:hypothetical protein
VTTLKSFIQLYKSTTMKNAIHSLVVIVFLLISFQSFSHNIWIETAGKGKMGQEHAAKIFLGGYGENERDSTEHWFSNTADVVVWLTAPNGKQIQLTKTPAGNCFVTSFKPSEEGIYTFSLKHEVADVYGTTKYVYYAAAKVQVGAATTSTNEWTAFSDLAIQTHAKGKEIKVKALYKNQLAVSATAAVGSPSGWSRQVELKSGEGVVDALWNGLYVFEIFYKEKSSGSWNGKEYNTVMHIATYGTEVFNK